MADKEREDLFVGKKPVMTYVIALLSYNKKARILSRGRNISKSVDVLEVFKRKYAKNVKYEIVTDTVELENRPISEVQINLTWE
jgi:DNA-binding protein Alba